MTKKEWASDDQKQKHVAEILRLRSLIGEMKEGMENLLFAFEGASLVHRKRDEAETSTLAAFAILDKARAESVPGQQGEE